jgi:hypothetical protein
MRKLVQAITLSTAFTMAVGSVCAGIDRDASIRSATKSCTSDNKVDPVIMQKLKDKISSALTIQNLDDRFKSLGLLQGEVWAAGEGAAKN